MAYSESRELDGIVQELRRHRVVLDELNAECRRARKERDARWSSQEDLMKALRADPSRETAVAYVAWCDDINGSSKMYEYEQDVEDRRRAARDALQALHVRLHEQLGVALGRADWERP